LHLFPNAGWPAARLSARHLIKPQFQLTTQINRVKKTYKDQAMYSIKVLEHLENPRNAGEMDDATVRGSAANPVCGDVLHLDLKIAEGKIAAARFKVQGCPPSIAAGSVLTEMITGLSTDDAKKLAPADVTSALESLPRNKHHCSVLAIDALRSALAQLPEDVL